MAPGKLCRDQPPLSAGMPRVSRSTVSHPRLFFYALGLEPGVRNRMIVCQLVLIIDSVSGNLTSNLTSNLLYPLLLFQRPHQ